MLNIHLLEVFIEINLDIKINIGFLFCYCLDHNCACVSFYCCTPRWLQKPS